MIVWFCWQNNPLLELSPLFSKLRHRPIPNNISTAPFQRIYQLRCYKSDYSQPVYILDHQKWKIGFTHCVPFPKFWHNCKCFYFILFFLPYLSPISFSHILCTSKNWYSGCWILCGSNFNNTSLNVTQLIITSY